MRNLPLIVAMTTRLANHQHLIFCSFSSRIRAGLLHEAGSLQHFCPLSYTPLHYRAEIRSSLPTKFQCTVLKAEGCRSQWKHVYPKGPKSSHLPSPDTDRVNSNICSRKLCHQYNCFHKLALKSDVLHHFSRVGHSKLSLK